MPLFLMHSRKNVTRFFFKNNVILILTYICIGTSYNKGIAYQKGWCKRERKEEVITYILKGNNIGPSQISRTSNDFSMTNYIPTTSIFDKNDELESLHIMYQDLSSKTKLHTRLNVPNK